MKLCVFSGDQRELLTCYNPKDMLALGVFNNNLLFMGRRRSLLQSKLTASDSIASENRFVKDGDVEVDSPIQIMLPDAMRENFYTWYVGVYYKSLGWEESFKETLDWHKKMIWSMFDIRESLNDYYIPEWKQALLELAWDFEQKPDSLIIRPQ